MGLPEGYDLSSRTKKDSNSLRFITHQSFFAAVRSGDLDSLKGLVQKLRGEDGSDQQLVSALTSLQNDAGETALYVAAENNLREIFSYLLRFCDLPTVMIRTKADMSAFHVAARSGHLEIVKELLGLWPEICKSCDSSNTSPLYSAAVMDQFDVVNAILDVDAGSARIVRKNGKTSLHTAARYGLLRIVSLLIDKDLGIVGIKDKKGQTALHMAVKGQCPLVVKEILAADPSVLNECDKKGNTALHIATRKCRPQIVNFLLSCTSLNVNAINDQQKTAMDLTGTLQYGESALEIKEALAEAGAMKAIHVGQANETVELKRTVSDIKHEVHSQFIQNEKTNKRVTGIAKELRKLHSEAVQNTTNSITVVAVLFASIAFLALFNLPGQYVEEGADAGKARVAANIGFQMFCLLNTISLFISLAVVVVQITLVAWDTRAQKMVVSVINKLMWTACICTCGAFLGVAFVIVGKKRSWMAVTITLMGTPILVGTLASMCYCVFRQRFGNESHRRIRRGSGSKSFSLSLHSTNISDLDDYDSDREKIYAL